MRRVRIPKAGKPGAYRQLGVPSSYDRVCQQALRNRGEPIFEPVFEEAHFGYRRGRTTQDAMRKEWKQSKSAREGMVDADRKDFFGSVDHDKLLAFGRPAGLGGSRIAVDRGEAQDGKVRSGAVISYRARNPARGGGIPISANLRGQAIDVKGWMWQ
jgi:hypothetical protein